MKILITGATGLIGKEVGKKLVEKGYQILVVSRDSQRARRSLPFPCEILEADLLAGPLPQDQLNSVEAVINLMGEPIVGQRWNEQSKAKIYDSRVLGTRHLVQSLPKSLNAFISGSAIGFYGDQGDNICDEESPLGSDFLAKITGDWELEALKAPGRVAIIRTGIVLSAQGGALEKMLLPFKAGVGGALGNGRQWMSWISKEDIAELFIFALENKDVRGALNGVSPQPVTNQDFSEKLAQSLNRSLGIPVPVFAMRLMLGESAQVVLNSVRCSADKACSYGYKFQHKDLSAYLNDIGVSFRQGEDVFYSEHFIPYPPEKIFEFFKDPYNLEHITPASLGFKIDSVSSERIQQGTLIDYSLKIHGVPVHWKTEIDEWSPPHRFVDNQLKGPYKLWHHTHDFKPFAGGTLMTDRVRYKVPLGYLGWLTAGSFVQSEIEGIFNFRRKIIDELIQTNPKKLLGEA